MSFGAFKSLAKYKVSETTSYSRRRYIILFDVDFSAPKINQITFSNLWTIASVINYPVLGQKRIYTYSYVYILIRKYISALQFTHRRTMNIIYRLFVYNIGIIILRCHDMTFEIQNINSRLSTELGSVANVNSTK